MKKKGFTLIELLAVIVILAVIALIATPRIIKILSDTRKNAAKESIYGVAQAAENYVSNLLLVNTGYTPEQEIKFECNGQKCELTQESKDMLDSANVEYKDELKVNGKVPANGTVNVSSDGKTVTVPQTVMNGFSCSYENNKSECSEIGTLASKVKIGDYVVYNPTAGIENPTTNPILQYTSPVGGLEVRDSLGNIILYESSYDENETYDSSIIVSNVNGVSFANKYDGVYKLIDENGNLDFDGYKVISDVPGNGLLNQNFKAISGMNGWRVIDVDKETGVIKLIQMNQITTTNGQTFSMIGLTGYKNAKRELDNISSIFGHGTGASSARSITIEDVNKLTGYNPTTVSGYNQPVTVGFANKSWNKTFYTYSSSTYPGTSGQNSEGINNSTIADTLFKRSNGNYKATWVASSSVEVTNNEMDVRQFVLYNGSVNAGKMYRTTPNGTSERTVYHFNSLCVYPVVILKPDVNYKSGDGSLSAPFRFQ